MRGGKGGHIQLVRVRIKLEMNGDMEDAEFEKYVKAMDEMID